MAMLLLVSGMCSLVFQTVWLREFRLVFGGSTPATAAVLAIFMGGLGLGNAVLGRRVDQSPSPLMLYARLELLITIITAISPLLIDIARSLYVAVGGQESLGLVAATIVRILLATLVIGVPTFLMGGTMPAAARAVTLHSDEGRGSVGLLYGLNTLGAVLGCVLSTFFLIEMFGTRSTLWLACAVNLAIAATAAMWALRSPLTSRRDAKEKQRATAPAARQSETPAEEALATSSSAVNPIHPAIIYTSAAIVGGVFFLMELVWYRMLGPIMGGSTYTFGLILAAALAGIGIGGALYPWIYRYRRPTAISFASTCAWEALVIAIPLALGDRVAMLAAMLQDLAIFGFSGQVVGWTVLVALVVFPAAVISGLQFPVLIALVGRADDHLGKQVGNTFAANTLGAMIGSLAGGFGLLPLLTAPGAWVLVVLLLSGLAAVIVAREIKAGSKSLSTFVPLAIIVIASLCLTMQGPTAAWRHSGIGAGRFQLASNTQNEYQRWLHQTRRITVWQAEGRESSVAINALNGAAFYINGKSDGNATQDVATQTMLGLLGCILHEDPKSGLIVGLGTGETAGWMAATKSIERVDVVELEPQIVEVAKVCEPLNEKVLENPKVRLLFNDAREVLLTTPLKYDLIVSEPSNPYRVGIASLFTREFYQAARSRLNEEGLFIQWMQGYEIDGRTVSTVLVTLRETFDQVEVWQTSELDMLLVCSAKPRLHSVASMKRRLTDPAIRRGASIAWRTNEVEGIFARFIANSELATKIASLESDSVNTDDHNQLEFGFARTVGTSIAGSILDLRNAAASIGAHRPFVSEGTVDWIRAEDHRAAFYALSGNALPPLQDATKEQLARFDALALLAAGQNAASIERWKSQPQLRANHSEHLLFARTLAAMGHDDASAEIEKLRAFHPLEADACQLIYDARCNRWNVVASQLRDVAVKLRTDATAHDSVLENVFALTQELIDRDPPAAKLIIEGFQEQFAALQREEQRILTLCYAAARTSPQMGAVAFEALEPNVPWEQRMLELRSDAYTRSRHPLADRARRDLESFQRAAGIQILSN